MTGRLLWKGTPLSGGLSVKSAAGLPLSLSEWVKEQFEHAPSHAAGRLPTKRPCPIEWCSGGRASRLFRPFRTALVPQLEAAVSLSVPVGEKNGV